MNSKDANSSADRKELPLCSWEGCFQKSSGSYEIEYGKGQHNLCEYHMIEATKLRAQRWCEARGLHTVEQKRAYCRNLFKGLIKPLPLTTK